MLPHSQENQWNNKKGTRMHFTVYAYTFLWTCIQCREIGEICIYFWSGRYIAHYQINLQWAQLFRAQQWTNFCVTYLRFSHEPSWIALGVNSLHWALPSHVIVKSYVWESLFCSDHNSRMAWNLSPCKSQHLFVTSFRLSQRAFQLCASVEFSFFW